MEILISMKKVDNNNNNNNNNHNHNHNHNHNNVQLERSLRKNSVVVSCF